MLFKHISDSCIAFCKVTEFMRCLDIKWLSKENFNVKSLFEGSINLHNESMNVTILSEELLGFQVEKM